MALQALWSPEQQFQNTNGSILTNGKIYIQYRGRTALAEVFGDASGEHRRANPVILDANGRALCFADDSFSYTAVVCDFYGKELFSFDPIPCGGGSGSSQITGAPSAHWLGRFGDTRVVNAGPYSDSLPLPSNPDYDGSFIESIQGNSNITLATGLYIIDAIVRFRQSPDDLQNLFGQVQVFTGWRDDETTWELRNETGPDSSQEDMHQFRVHLVRHVTGNGDKNFCIQVKTPVNWSWCQIQSLSILSLSSSSGGYGQYIPGDYIQITDDGTINVVGLQPSGNYANAESVAEAFYGVAQDMNALSGQINEVSGQIPSLDGYATEQYVQSQVSGKADKSEIPSLQGYATEEWVHQQNYLTEVPSQYVTDSELNSAISGKADKSEIPSLDGFATEEYVQEQVSGLASESYVQSAVSGKQDELEFTYDSENKITSIDGHGIAGTGGGGGSGAVYTPGQYISIQNDIISVTGLQPSGEYLIQDDLNGYATDDDVQAAVSGKADKSEIPSLQGYATEEWVGQQGYLTSIPSEYITETELESELSGKADVSAIPSLSGYATEYWVTEQGYLTEVPSEYVTETELASELSGKADVSAIPSLQGYATETWVSQQGYATTDDVDEATSGKLDASAYVAPLNADWSATSGLSQILNKPEQSQLIPGSGIEITQSGADYVISSTGGGSTYTEGDYISIQNDVISVTGLQPSGEYLVPQDLNGYATNDDVIAATSGKQDTLEFGYTSGGSVSAINNSGIYDAPLNDFVNQNSGAWGGEAFPVSGGPGVKFRVRNGTLIAEADETVLWEGVYSGTIGSSNYITLSESPSAFEHVKVVNGGTYQSSYEYNGSSTQWTFMQTFANTTDTTVYAVRFLLDQSNKRVTCQASNSLRLQANSVSNWANRTSLNVGEEQLTKIIGVNRRAGN